jgi:hypothetical protein
MNKMMLLSEKQAVEFETFIEVKEN